MELVPAPGEAAAPADLAGVLEVARHTPGRSRSDKRRAQLARAGLIPAGDPTGRSASIAGVIVRRGKSLEVEPLFQPGPALPVERSPIKPQPGDLVLFTFSLRVQGPDRPLLWARATCSATSWRRCWSTAWSSGVSARRCWRRRRRRPRLNQHEDSNRTDLRDLYTFTVDPVMAQDFDDALSFERTPAGTTTVYVHIADVSYFVKEGTALDKEALRRGNSVYVATGVEPMLPPQLSSGVCSLRPDEDRKTVTVEMEVDDSGRVLGSRFYRSLIRSDKRLDYEQLERMFRGTEPMDASLAQPLEWGRTLAQTLREVRHERGVACGSSPPSRSSSGTSRAR